MSNRSPDTFSDVSFKVTELSGGNQLLNADGGPGGSGTEISVAGDIGPGDVFGVEFEIGLDERLPFRFFFDAFDHSAGGDRDPSGRRSAAPFQKFFFGRMVVEARVSPGNSTQTFTYRGDASGTLEHRETLIELKLSPGTFTVTQADPSADGFDLARIKCTGQGKGDVGSRTATFTLRKAKTVSCTFFNEASN